MPNFNGWTTRLPLRLPTLCFRVGVDPVDQVVQTAMQSQPE
jgi:hypothetical protein